MPPAAFSVHGNKVAVLCMEICKEMRYNFNVGCDQQSERSNGMMGNRKSPLGAFTVLKNVDF